MRERFLCKGKRIDNGKWVEGEYIEDCFWGHHCMFVKPYKYPIEVDFNTVEPIAIRVVLKDKAPYAWSEETPLHSIHCPNCDSYLAEKPRDKSIKQTLMRHENKPDKFNAYCNFRGQRLDWSEEK